MIRLGKSDEAIEALQRAINIQSHALAYVNLGICVFALGNREEAIANYTLAIEMEPECAAAHRLAEVFAAQGAWDKAEASLKMAL